MSKLSYDAREFYLDGAPFRVLSGAIHYFRVVPEYWEDRLRKLAQCGLNTVETYVCWNLHEREKGEFDFSGRLDLVRYLKTAQELGLYVILRPGPYICAEWEMGGLPYWLLKEKDIALRCDNEAYLAAARSFLRRLFDEIRPCMAVNGGPVIAVSLENEYGSFGNDKAYLQKLLEIYRECGIEELIFTSDGPTWYMLNGGTLSGVLATVNFGSRPEESFELLKEYRPGQPLFCMEFWNGWFDHWYEEHHTRESSDVADVYDRMLSMGASVNIYMFHGGTNFGLWNGANYADFYQPTVTSYDYGALLTEAGDLTETYHAVRRVVEKYVGGLGELTVKNLPKAAYGKLVFTESAGLLQYLEGAGKEYPAGCTSRRKPVWNPRPLSFEALGQDVGIVAYETRLQGPYPEMELFIDGLCDRAVVLLDGELLGVKENTGMRDDRIVVDVKRGESRRLTILVENLGRVNYGGHIADGKGILGGVRLANQYLFGWEMYRLGEEYPEGLAYENLPESGVSAVSPRVCRTPRFYRGSFTVEERQDTFVHISGFSMGWVYINGFLLGRYLKAGPQHSLYLPAPFLREGRNELTVLELESAELREGYPYAELTDEV